MAIYQTIGGRKARYSVQEDRVAQVSLPEFSNLSTDAVKKAVLKETIAVLQAEHGQMSNVGATVIGTVIDPIASKFYTVAVGDCVSYFVTVGAAPDYAVNIEALHPALHSTANPDENARIKADAEKNNRFSPTRDKGSFAIKGLADDKMGYRRINVSRGLGDMAYKSRGHSSEAETMVTTIPQISAGSKGFVIVACDGFTEQMDLSENFNAIKQVIHTVIENHPNGDSREFAKELGKQIEAESTDNLSILVTEVGHDVEQKTRALIIFDGHGGSAVSEGARKTCIPTINTLIRAKNNDYSQLASWSPAVMAAFAVTANGDTVARLVNGTMTAPRNSGFRGFLNRMGLGSFTQPVRDTLAKAHGAAIARIALAHADNANILQTIFNANPLRKKLDGATLLTLIAANNEAINNSIQRDEELMRILQKHNDALLKEVKTFFEQHEPAASRLRKLQAWFFPKRNVPVENLAIKINESGFFQLINYFARDGVLNATDKTAFAKLLVDMLLRKLLRDCIDVQELIMDVLNVPGRKLLMDEITNFSKEDLFLLLSRVVVIADETLFEKFFIHCPTTLLARLLTDDGKILELANNFPARKKQFRLKTYQQVFNHFEALEEDVREKYLAYFETMSLAEQLTIYFKLNADMTSEEASVRLEEHFWRRIEPLLLEPVHQIAMVNWLDDLKMQTDMDVFFVDQVLRQKGWNSAKMATILMAGLNNGAGVSTLASIFRRATNNAAEQKSAPLLSNAILDEPQLFKAVVCKLVDNDQAALDCIREHIAKEPIALIKNNLEALSVISLEKKLTRLQLASYFERYPELLLKMTITPEDEKYIEQNKEMLLPLLTQTFTAAHSYGKSNLVIDFVEAYPQLAAWLKEQLPKQEVVTKMTGYGCTMRFFANIQLQGASGVGPSSSPGIKIGQAG